MHSSSISKAATHRTLPWLLACVLASPAAHSGGVPSISLWSTSLGMPGETRAAAADLDGDGRDEVVGMSSMFSGQARTGTAVSVQGFDASNVWTVLQLEFGDEDFLAGTVVGRRVGGDIIAAAVTRPDSGGVLRRFVDYFEGFPLVRTRSVPIESYRWPEALRDVDGDGDLDLITQGGTGVAFAQSLRAEDLITGQQLWTHPIAVQPRTLSYVQLDADPALEIAIGGSQGSIIDGATGLLEWTSSTAFGLVVAGDFGPGAPPTFATGYLGDISFFRGPPYALTESHEVMGDPVFAINLDDDSEDELATVNGYSVAFFDRRDRDGAATIVANLRLEEMYTKSASLSELDGDPEPEVLALDGRAGVLQSGSERGAVFDPISGDALADFWSQRFDAMPIVVVPFSGAGAEQVALFSLVAGGGSMAGVQLLDAVTGDPGLKTDVLHQLSGGQPPSFASVQLDADPQAEILLGRRTDIESGYIALDGKTLRLQVFGPAPTDPWGPRFSSFVDVADVDGDGEREIVVVDEPDRVRILDVATGAIEWESPSMERWVRSAQSFQVDADPALELLIWDGKDLHVFDGATHDLQWEIESEHFGALHAFRDQGSCRLVVIAPEAAGSASGALEMFDCNGAPLRELSIPLVEGFDQFFAVHRGDGYMFSRGRLLRIDLETGASTTISGMVGPSAGLRRDSVVFRTTDSGDLELLFANDGKVERLQVILPDSFADGFEGGGNALGLP
jgi:hypothetical protein